MADIFADDFSLDSNSDHPNVSGIEKQPNPFSFSNFLGSKDFASYEDAATTTTTTTKNVKDEVNVININDDDDSEEENPFSFQNFAASITSKNNCNNLQVNKGDECSILGWDDISESLNDTYETDSEESGHLVKIENLCKENTSLRNELSKVRDEFLEYRRTANKRVTCLQKELEKVRKKEAEETRDLDNVVRMVEENLQKTTARAVSAETTVSKLKEELKLLKHECVSKQNYDKLVLEHIHLLNTVQDKSRNVAQLMRTAAEKTEPHVKQLQSGVASLRFFAEQFDDICKIAEIPMENNSRDNM